MSIAEVGTAQTNNVGSGSCPISIPSGGGTLGNVLIGVIGAANGVAIVIPTGLTQFGTTFVGSNNNYIVVYRICTGSDPTSYDANLSGNTNGAFGWLSAWSGTDLVTPIENPTWGTPPSTTTQVIPSTLVSYANSVWLKYCTGFTGGNFASVSTAPAGTQVLNAPAQYFSIAVYDAAASPSSTGTDSIVWSTTVIEPALSFIIRPPHGPIITSEPQSEGVASGSTAAFSVTATSSGGTETYQWYSAPVTGNLYENVPGAWQPIGGATSSSYTTPSLASANNGQWYYCALSDSNGTVNTLPVRAWIIGMPSAGKGLLLKSSWPQDFKQAAFSHTTDIGKKVQQFGYTDQVGYQLFPTYLLPPAGDTLMGQIQL
jgi:hypothetical protein